jgi:hypothetical protein
MYGNKSFLMKKNSLLSLVLLAVLASGVSAAAQTDVLNLPTYVVETERYAAAEQHVADSLNALRAQASTPVLVRLELPALKTEVAATAKPLTTVRLAKS